MMTTPRSRGPGATAVRSTAQRKVLRVRACGSEDAVRTSSQGASSEDPQPPHVSCDGAIRRLALLVYVTVGWLLLFLTGTAQINVNQIAAREGTCLRDSFQIASASYYHDAASQTLQRLGSRKLFCHSIKAAANSLCMKITAGVGGGGTK